MRTELTRSPTLAASFIRRGGIVAFPTETVFGLGADAFDEAAIAKIFAAKMRPSDNPLIAHIGDLEQIALLAIEIPEKAQLLIDSFFPGPLTVVLKKSDAVLTIATAGLDSIGIRMPRNELASKFLQSCGTPVVAPSANLSGHPSPTTWEAVYEDLNGRIDCLLKGTPTEIGLESTVVDCTGEVPILLRQGAVSLGELQSIVPSTRFAEYETGDQARSPGLKHKHYSPRAEVIVVETDSYEMNPGAAYIGINKPSAECAFVRLVYDPTEYAHELFEFFRECDRRGSDIIYCEAVAEDGIGAALMDRLRRAAEK